MKLRKKKTFKIISTTALCLAALLNLAACSSGSSAGSQAADVSGSTASSVSTVESSPADISESASSSETNSSANSSGPILSEDAGARRTLPDEAGANGSTTSSAEASSDTSPTEDEGPVAVYPSGTDEIVPAGTITGGSVMFVPVSSAKDPVITEKKDDSYPDSQEDVDQVLKGLSDYWAAGDMNAVDYLVRMDKYRYLSGTLEGTADYYYYGSENAAGEPDGTGVAVYAGNQYYYGSFVNGVREGNGFWYQIYVKDGPFCRANNGVYGHSYNGEWKNGLPEGQGQEHLDIDQSYLKGRLIANMVGMFTSGYYNGDFRGNSFGDEEGEIGWTGTCRYGTWVPFDNSIHLGQNGEKEVRVLQNTENNENYFYMLQDENHGQGIYGIVK